MKVINRDVAKLLTMAALCRVIQNRRPDWSLSDYLFGMEAAFMSVALETMLRVDISQEITAEIGEGLEQCV